MRFLTKDWVILSLLGLGLVFPGLLFVFDLNIGESNKIDPDIASNVAGYIAGTTGVLWGLASIIFIYKAFVGSQEQQIENTFFSMMTLLNDIINNMKGTINGNEYHGTSFFLGFHSNFRTTVTNSINLYKQEELQKKDPKDIPELFSALEISLSAKKSWYKLKYITWCFNTVYSHNQAQLGHFFRYVYNIITHVHRSSLSTKRKKELVNIIQAQLSNDLLGIIFYNGLTDQGKNFKKIIEESYSDFFENIDAGSLIQPEDANAYNVRFKHIKVDNKSQYE